MEGSPIPTVECKTKLVAIVDDDESMRRALGGLMKATGFPARCFASAEEFLDSRHVGQTDCLIVDVRMPGMSGLALQTKLNAEGFRIPTIVITVDSGESTRQQALSGGAVALFTKPFDDEALLECVRAALAC